MDQRRERVGEVDQRRERFGEVDQRRERFGEVHGALSSNQGLPLNFLSVMARTAADDGVFEDGAVKVEQVKLDRSMHKKCPYLPKKWNED